MRIFLLDLKANACSLVASTAYGTCISLRVAFSQVHVPLEAFQSIWTEHREEWGARMKLSSSIEELLQVFLHFQMLSSRYNCYMPTSNPWIF